MTDLLALISKTADGVFAVDREQRIVFWNNAAAALLGLSAQEVLGRFCYEVIAGRDESGRLVCHANCGSLMTALRQDLVPTHDLVVRTKASQEVWLNVSTIVVPSQWMDLFVLVHLFRDVSREKEIGHFVQQLLSTVEKLSMSPGNEPLIRPPLPPSSMDVTTREREVLRLLASGSS
ncbi:MAG: PAS domain-containing protein, partial [Nitrospiraceae bacterium]